ncbi:RNase H domain-containing protein [Trichonephila clavipes]|nr:RNase H domain-containing protein [Trichonephila clavipes]
MVVVRIRVELGVVFIATFMGTMLKTAAGILTPVPSLDRNSLLLVYALDHAFNSYKGSIWILTDSRSSIQYLKNWPKIKDSTGLDILSKLVRLGQRKQVCFQWIPSHVGVPGNEGADELAGKGCDLPNPSSTVLTHTGIHSFQRNKMNLTWRNTPALHTPTLPRS